MPCRSLQPPPMHDHHSSTVDEASLPASPTRSRTGPSRRPRDSPVNRPQWTSVPGLRESQRRHQLWARATLDLNTFKSRVEPMKIVIPGGSGHIGRLLGRALAAEHELVVLSRRGHGRRSGVRTVWWDGRSVGDWVRELDGCDAVINLAGRSVNCRYNAVNLREMLDSRVESTRVVGEAIARAARPPRVWLQMSTAPIYSHRFDAPNDEESGIIGGAEP